MDKENIFQGKRVRLRAPEPSDGAVHFEMDSQYTNVARANYFVTFPGSAVRVNDWAKTQSEQIPMKHEQHLQIESIDSGDLVGSINSINCSLRNGTFSYGIVIFPPYHKKGYASEAIILFMRYFFMELRYQKVVAHVYGFNNASISLHEKLGFSLEGRLRRMIYTAGEYYDELIFGMLNEEFQEKYNDYWQENSV